MPPWDFEKIEVGGTYFFHKKIFCGKEKSLVRSNKFLISPRKMASLRHFLGRQPGQLSSATIGSGAAFATADLAGDLAGDFATADEDDEEGFEAR